MNKERESFIFYRSFYEASKALKDAERLALFDAICESALNQNETEKEPIVKAMFSLIEPQLQANLRRYENGKNGGRPTKNKKPKDNQTETKPKPNDNVNVNVNVNKNDNGFNLFWDKYPKGANGKGNKKTAKDKFVIALKKTSLDVLMKAIEDYSKTQVVQSGYAKHCVTWLNQESWEDDYVVGDVNLFDNESESLNKVDTSNNDAMAQMRKDMGIDL